jgi:hypothetical protein
LDLLSPELRELAGVRFSELRSEAHIARRSYSSHLATKTAAEIFSFGAYI